MKAFLCIALLAAAALAAPEGKRDKRGYLSSGWLDSGYGSLAPSYAYGAYSLGESLLSHSAIVHEPAIINEPAIVSVRKIVEVPKVVSVNKVVSVPRVVSAPHVTSHLSGLSYEPALSTGWW